MALNSGWWCRCRLFYYLVLLLNGSEQEQLSVTLNNPGSVGGRLMLEDFNFKLGHGPIVLLD